MFAPSCTKFLRVAQNCTTVAQCNPCATALAPSSRLLLLLPQLNLHLLAAGLICNGFTRKCYFNVH